MTGLLTCTSWHASLSYNWRHISPWTKVFCLEIYFLLYFSCTFNLLFRNSSFHGFFFFFWKKNLWCERRSDVVWEWLSQFWPSKYSWAGIIISSCTGNHLVFFQKIQKRSSLPFSLDLDGVWISVNSWCAQPLSRWMQAFEELHPRGRWFGQRVLPPHLFTSETDTRTKEWLDQDAS